MTWSVGGVVNYAFKPFVVRSCTATTGVESCDDPGAGPITDIPVVENLVTVDALASLTVIPELQLGLRVPLTWVKGQGLSATGTADPDALETVGLGDIELEAKGRVFGAPQDPIALGVLVYGTAPMGNITAEGSYIGDSTPSVGGSAIVDGLFGPLTWAANLGGVWRGTGSVGATELGAEGRYGAAVGYRVGPVVNLMVDAFGSTNFTADRGANALEIDGAVQFIPLGSQFTFTAGAGAGVVKGIGVPDFRAFIGALFNAEVKDRDEDGMPDDTDQCPTEAEDVDGYEDSDGCPDLDDDLDNIPDSADKCPKDAEDIDGFEDTDGCPDFDNDKDGIPDTGDQCKDEPETKNNYQDDDGCPDEADTDQDGVPDKEDKCPAEPEDTDGFEDTDGCPDTDNDQDGIPDVQDECIDEPETVNDIDDEDGCPEEEE